MKESSLFVDIDPVALADELGERLAGAFAIRAPQSLYKPRSIVSAPAAGPGRNRLNPATWCNGSATAAGG